MNFNLVIVDDDPDTILLHSIISKKAGFDGNTLTFPGGQELIDYFTEYFNDESPNHLIFLDIYMIPVDGWMVLDFLKTLNRPDKIKVILISSSVNISDKRKAIKYHSVIEYIEKPLMTKYLINLKNQVIF
jgi:CheY-like chemotaxis protein